MMRKSRLLSLFAVFALPLGLTSVAGAQSDSQTVGATLVADVCAVDLRIFQGGLGTWTYDGTAGAYVLTSSTSRVTLEGEYLSADAPSGGCDWRIGFGGLTGPGGTIDTTHFRMINAAGVEVDATGFTVEGVTGSGYFFDLVLDSVPVLEEGAYTGQIDVTVTDAA
jgi:hypothetical protein